MFTWKKGVVCASVFLLSLFFNTSASNAAVQNGACVCNTLSLSKTTNHRLVGDVYASDEPLFASGKTPTTAEECNSNPRIVVGRIVSDKSQCVDGGNFKDCIYQPVVGSDPYGMGPCVCRDLTATCKWKPSVCCCHKTDTSLECIKSSAFQGDTAICNEQVFSDPENTKATANLCVCYLPPKQPSRINVGAGDQDTCLKYNGSQNTQDGDTFMYGDCSWNGSNKTCACTQTWSSQVRKNFISGVKSQAECDPRALLASGKDNNTYQKCDWRPSDATQAGYAVQPIKNDGSCNYELPPDQYTIQPSDLQQKAKDLNKLTAFTSPQQIIAQGIKILFSFIGSIALIMYIVAGVYYMTAAGNTERAGKAKQLVVWTTLSLIVMLSSYVLVKLLFGTLLQLPGVS